MTTNINISSCWNTDRTGCQYAAQMMCWVADRLGIECEAVVDDIFASHIVNKVTIDGESYRFDACPYANTGFFDESDIIYVDFSQYE